MKDVFHMTRALPFLVTSVACWVGGAAAAQPTMSMVTQMDDHVGEMSVPMNSAGEELTIDIDDAFRFEPLQNFNDMFLRDDVVFLMRHGPTNWSKLDEYEVAPTDCENQRIMSEEGTQNMRVHGALLALNEIKPGRIIVSEWCRNQQTLAAMAEGYEAIEPGVWETIPVETSADLNLLLSLQGAPNVTPMREMISNWDGSDGDGPLLLISHFTNIQELTEFSVYEGETLILDPDRRNRVLGYLRLRSAGPDVGHFDVEDIERIYNEDGSLNEESTAIPSD